MIKVHLIFFIIPIVFLSLVARGDFSLESDQLLAEHFKGTSSSRDITRSIFYDPILVSEKLDDFRQSVRKHFASQVTGTILSQQEVEAETQLLMELEEQISLKVAVHNMEATEQRMFQVVLGSFVGAIVGGLFGKRHTPVDVRFQRAVIGSLSGLSFGELHHTVWGSKIQRSLSIRQINEQALEDLLSEQ